MKQRTTESRPHTLTRLRATAVRHSRFTLRAMSLALACVSTVGQFATAQTTEKVASIEPITVPIDIQPPVGKVIKLDAKYTSIRQPDAPTAPVTLKNAVDFAEQNYPSIIRSLAQLRATNENVHMQKLNEYMPDSLFQYQEFMASHNQLSSVFYGSPVFPGISGPGFNNVSMQPVFSANTGFSIDWAPLDFGLHRARIDSTKLQAMQAASSLQATRIDVITAVANAFLDTALAIEQVHAAEANVRSFEKFNSIVEAQITGALKPAADGYLSRAQLANAQNDLIRAKLQQSIALARLATAMGIGGKDVAINSMGLATTDEPADLQKAPPVFSEVPLVKVAQISLLNAIQSKKIIDKEYFPVFHFIGGVNVRGSQLSPYTGVIGGQPAAGTLPTRPNYWLSFIVNWNFLDYWRLKSESRIQTQRIYQQQQDYNLVLQNLRGRDAEARATVTAAVALAQNMPIQVESANIAMRLAETRYSTGLGSIAQIAQAAQVLANARVKQAAARIGVWRALLEIAYVHGDLTPFIREADKVQRGI